MTRAAPPPPPPEVPCPCGLSAPRVCVGCGVDLHACACGRWLDRWWCCGAVRQAIYCCRSAIEHYYRMGTSFKSKVYFIEAEGLNRIKIGCSKHPEDRLRELSTGSAVKLRLMKVANGDRRSERSLHRMFNHLHIEGEWFHGSFDLRDYIEKR